MYVPVYAWEEHAFPGVEEEVNSTHENIKLCEGVGERIVSKVFVTEA